MSSQLQTQYSLLQRAVDLKDNEAWEIVFDKYRHFIFGVLKHLGVPTNDIEDLAQQVLSALTQSLPNYDRNKAKFRVWLSTIIRNKTNSYFRKHYNRQRSLNQLTNENHVRAYVSVPEIEKIIEKKWAIYIANQAMYRVRKVFRGKAIEVFELNLHGYSASCIAKKTQLTVATVYTLKKRVKKRFYLEIRQLAFELE